MTSSPVTERFIEALSRLEAAREVEPMAALFDAAAELRKLGDQNAQRGPEGARVFWQQYRDAFGTTVQSRFDRKLSCGDCAVLEWQTEGTLADGRPIDYRGVSILEVRGDAIVGFRTYYDSAAFVPAAPAARA